MNVGWPVVGCAAGAVGVVAGGVVAVVVLPPGVIRPIELLPRLVNHRFPSGPATIPSGRLMPAPVKLATTPVGVIRPIDWLP